MRCRTYRQNNGERDLARNLSAARDQNFCIGVIHIEAAGKVPDDIQVDVWVWDHRVPGLKTHLPLEHTILALRFTLGIKSVIRSSIALRRWSVSVRI